MDDLAILILAAGAGARMRGGDKLLERVEGVPLLRRHALAALSLGCPVVVTLPFDRPERARALEGLDVSLVEVSDAHEGMAASLRAGVRGAPAQTSGVLVLPADMPEITAQDLAHVIAGFDGSTIVRATTASGTPGHPVIFPAASFPALLELHGDTGARAVLAQSAVQTVALPGDHAITDLDTPEDWAAWRARHPSR